MTELDAELVILLDKITGRDDEQYPRFRLGNIRDAVAEVIALGDRGRVLIG